MCDAVVEVHRDEATQADGTQRVLGRSNQPEDEERRQRREDRLGDDDDEGDDRFDDHEAQEQEWRRKSKEQARHGQRAQDEPSGYSGDQQRRRGCVAQQKDICAGSYRQGGDEHYGAQRTRGERRDDVDGGSSGDSAGSVGVHVGWGGFVRVGTDSGNAAHLGEGSD